MKQVTENVKHVTDNVLQVTASLRQLIRFIPGSPPGQIEHLEEAENQPVQYKACLYSEKEIVPLEIQNHEELPFVPPPGFKAFILVEGMKNTRVIQKIGDRCDLHVLEIEDILNTRHRPKIDFYENHAFILFRILSDDHNTLKYEHCAMILSKNYVLVIREHSDDQFLPIFNRIQNPQSRIRNNHTDYLAYTILDLAADRMTMVHTKLLTDCYQLEETYLENTTDQTLYTIKTMHRKVIALMRTSGPTRELISQVINNKSSLLEEDTVRFMEDVLDHVVQSHEQCLHLRDLVTGMINLHLSNVGQTTNEIMKFLTIMGSLFIPLTFIAGIYGMNFDYMPELRWQYGYFGIWGVMLGTAAGLLLYFRKRGWL